MRGISTKIAMKIICRIKETIVVYLLLVLSFPPDSNRLSSNISLLSVEIPT